MKRLIPFLSLMAFMFACSPEELDVKKPDTSEELKTASVIINNIPDGMEGDSVYVFTLNNQGEFYSATRGSAMEDAVVKTTAPEGNSSFTIIAYIPTVSEWTIEDAFDNGWYSTITGAKNRNGRYITNSWDQASSYNNSNRSGMNNTLEVELDVYSNQILRSAAAVDDYDQGDILYLEASVDNNTLSNIVSVDFSVDGNIIESLVEEPYEINYNTIDLAPGIHTISVMVSNADGDEAMDDVEIIILTEENEAPYVNLGGITNGSSYTRQTVRTISSNAYDPEGRLDRVEFRINGSLVATVTEAPYNYTWDTYDNQVGNVTVEITAFDEEGAERSDFANVTLVAPANYAPRATITSPSNGTSITIGSLITINATTSDDEGDAIGAVRFYFDGSTLGYDYDAPYSYQDFNTAGYSAGEYEITVRVYDESYNQSSTETITITLTE